MCASCEYLGVCSGVGANSSHSEAAPERIVMLPSRSSRRVMPYANPVAMYCCERSAVSSRIGSSTRCRNGRRAEAAGLHRETLQARPLRVEPLLELHGVRDVEPREQITPISRERTVELLRGDVVQHLGDVGDQQAGSTPTSSSPRVRIASSGGAGAAGRAHFEARCGRAPA
jgi:hypothetical protein